MMMGCLMRMFCMSVDTDEFEEQHRSMNEFDSI